MKINTPRLVFHPESALLLALCALCACPLGVLASGFTRLVPAHPANVIKIEGDETFFGDENSAVQYPAGDTGALTCVEYHFDAPVTIHALRRIERSNASIPESDMIFLDDSGKEIDRITSITPRLRSGSGKIEILPAPVTARHIRWQVTKRPDAGKINMNGNDFAFYAAGHVERKPSAITIKTSAPPIALRTENGPRQTLKAAIEYPYVEPASVTIQCGDGTPRAATLAPGGQTFEFPIPVSKEKRRTFVLTIKDKSGAVLARENVIVPAFREMTLHVLPHSHLDIGFTERQPDVDEKQMNHLLIAMELAERTANYPEGSRYVWNLECAWPADLLMRRVGPAQQERFLDAVRNGRLSVNASLFNSLTALCSPEELIRLFETAVALRAKTGAPIDTMMTSDTPGLTWGAVTAMRQAGVKYYNSAPNLGTRGTDINKQWQNKPFWWIGPSKDDRVLVWVPYGGYGLGQRAGTIARGWIETMLNDLERDNYPYDIATIRWARGDNSPPDQKLPDQVRAWNERYEWPRIIISSAHSAFAALERKYGSRLPEYRGDWTPFWEDGAGTTALETAQHRAAADRLSQSETLWAMLQPASYPAADFARAMRSTLFFTEHTWGASLSVRAPLEQESQDQWNYKRNHAGHADIETHDLLARALALARHNDPAPSDAQVDIFNTHSWPRGGLVILPKNFTGGYNRVTDDTGASVPSQRLSTGELAIRTENIPPYASRRYTISAGEPHAPPRPVVMTQTTLDNGLVKVALDVKTGDINELRAAASGAKNNLADTTSAPGETLNTYLYYLGNDCKNAKSSGTPVIRARENGPLVASLVVESSAPGCHSLLREIRLVAGNDYAEISNIVDKARLIAKRYREDLVNGKESLNFAFPFNIPGGQVRVEAPLSITRPDADQIPGSCKNWFTTGRWIDIANQKNGVTWVTLDAPLVQIGGLTANLLNASSAPSLWVKQVGPVQKLYSWAMNNHWGVNYRPYQEGPVTFRFLLRPHGPYDAAAASRFAIGASQPLQPVRASGANPLSASRLTLDSPDVIVTALKPSNDKQALILRLWNTGSRDTTTAIHWSAPAPRRVTLSNTAEETLDKIDGPIAIPAQGLVTLRAELQ